MHWIKATTNVAETLKITVPQTFDLSITEYLNMLSYVKWNNKEIEKNLKKK